MPSIFDPPPPAAAADLAAVVAALDATVPARRIDSNLLIATWNLRAFGDLTENWVGSDADSPKRNLHALRCIAEIVARFDVVAIQEVRENIKCLRHMLKVLGPNWGMLLTDVTKGDQGNYERIAFVFDTRRVKPSGLACELVVPEKEDGSPVAAANAFQRQFARTPYAASFLAGDATFILVTLHVYYGTGDAAQNRIPELTAIAQWLADWARKASDWGHNIIALGDFNIDRINDPLYQAFTSTGLRPAPGLMTAPRTIFHNPNVADTQHFYDQIAWFTGAPGEPPALSMTYSSAGNFDFVPCVMTNLTKQALSWRMSDHYPLWTEFALR